MEMKTANKEDVYESTVRRVDELATKKTGMGALHWLTLGSIAASLSLYLSGKKDLAFFVGLWPPTFLALKSAAETKKEAQ
jgi:hypothetical protein